MIVVIKTRGRMRVTLVECAQRWILVALWDILEYVYLIAGQDSVGF